MNASKRKISIKNLEDAVHNMSMGTIASLVRTVSVLGSTFEEYIAMKGDTKKFVNHLEKVIKDENRSTKTGEKESTKRSGARKTSSKDS